MDIALAVVLIFSSISMGSATASKRPDHVPVGSQNVHANEAENKEALAIGLLGSLEIAAEGLAETRKWQDLLDRLTKERGAYSACQPTSLKECSPALLAWRRELQRISNFDSLKKLRALNAYANRQARYTDDALNYGEQDYWATPLEFLRGYADCEDYAVFKFVSLLDLGFDPADIRFVIVKDDLLGSFHAVVTVEIEGHVYILDSLDEGIASDDMLFRYRPLRSFGLSTSYLHVVTDQIRLNYLVQLALRGSEPIPGRRLPIETSEVPQSYHDARLLNCRGCDAQVSALDGGTLAKSVS